MQFPKKALFAFNANIDHLKISDGAVVEAIDKALPQLASQMNESFSWGMQKEVTIDVRACDWLLANVKFDSRLVGGQAGNAAEQASCLGVDSYVHSNFANENLAKLFSRPEKIFFGSEQGFSSASSTASSVKSAHHFVFENRETRTRFIASYDPFPLHPEDNFCRHIDAQLPSISKAFIGGLHLVKTPDRVRKFISEVKRWKGINPFLEIFFEMGEFQSREALGAVREELFPFVDMVGLTDSELSSLGCDLEELAPEVKSILFHSPEEQLVLPYTKLNGAALEFAKRCASYFAEKGKRASEQDLVGYESKFIEAPVRTVGLGDTFSCAYFMAD